MNHQILFDSIGKTRCVMCGEHINTHENKITCSIKCHEELLKLAEQEFGIIKEVMCAETGITYCVPTRDIIEKGIVWKDLQKYPVLKDELKDESEKESKDESEKELKEYAFSYMERRTNVVMKYLKDRNINSIEEVDKLSFDEILKMREDIEKIVEDSRKYRKDSRR